MVRNHFICNTDVEIEVCNNYQIMTLSGFQIGKSSLTYWKVKKLLGEYLTNINHNFEHHYNNLWLV